MASRTFSVIFKGDASDAKRVTGEMEGHFSAFGAAVTGAFFGIGQQIGQDLLSLGEKVASFGFDSANKFRDLGLEVAKVQRLTGMSAESASGLVTVASEYGVSTDSLTKALRIMDKNLVSNTDNSKALNKEQKASQSASESLAKAQQHLADVHAELAGKTTLTVQQQIQLRDAQQAVNAASEKSAAAAGINTAQVEAFGIRVKDMNGNWRDSKDILADIADKFQDLGPGIDAGAQAVKIFGRGGADMLPVLMQGGDAIRQMSDDADKLGTLMGQDGVNSAKAYAHSQHELSLTWTGIQQQIGGVLAPILTDLNNRLVAWATSPEFKQALNDFKDWLSVQIPQAVEWVKENAPKIFKSISDWWSEHGQQLIDGVKGLIDGAIGIYNGFIKVGDWLREHVGTVDDFKNGINQLKDGFQVLGDKAGWVKDHILDPIAGTAQTVGGWFIWLKDHAIDPLVGTVQDFAKPVLDRLGDTFDHIKTVIGWVGQALGWLKNEVFDPVIGALQTAFSWFKDNFLDPVWGVIEKIAGALSGPLSWVKDHLMGVGIGAESGGGGDAAGAATPGGGGGGGGDGGGDSFGTRAGMYFGSSLPKFATGGYVGASAGGTAVIVGDGGEGEHIIPDSKMGGITIHVHALNATAETGRLIVQAIKDYRDGGGTLAA